MAYFPGTYIPTDASSTARANYIIDNMLLPRIMNYRQLRIFDEKPNLLDDNATWKCTYSSWTDAPILVVKNGLRLPSSGYTSLDRVYGTFKTGTLKRGDDVRVSYEFDYFPVKVLEGILAMAVSIINTSAVGNPTEYTLSNAPTSWDGLIADLALAQCMERLIIDFTLWKGRLIFAIGNDLLTGGGGDITSALETIKTNAENRANKALDNPQLKSPNMVAPPTVYYYQSLIIGGSSRQGKNTSPTQYGKMHGMTINKYLGGTL